MVQCKEEGMSEEKACQYAISQMGSPQKIGSQFAKLYTPQWNPFWFIGLLFVCFMSVLSIYFFGGTKEYITKHLFYLATGFILFLCVIKIDLSDLKKASYLLYTCSLVLLGLIAMGQLLFDDFLSTKYPNGGKLYYYNLLYKYLMIPLFIGLVGIFIDKKRNLSKMMLFLLIPILLTFFFTFLFDQKLNIFVGYISFYLLLFFCSDLSKSKKTIYGSTIALASVLLLMITIIKEPYLYARLKMLFNPSLDADGIGYFQTRSLAMFRHSHFIGKGDPILYKSALIDVAGDGIFPTITYEFGYGVSLFIVFILGVVLFQLTKKIVQTKHFYLTIIGYTMLLFLISPMLINLLMNFSLFPMQISPIPFLSFTGYSTYFYFILMGVVINISSKKQMYRLILN